MKRDSCLLISCTGLVVDPTTKTLPMEIDALIEGDHGRHQRLDGKMVDVVVTASDVDAAVDYVKRRRQREPNRTFVIDYEHQTMFGTKAPAAGWYKDLNAVTRDGKRVARATIENWTPDAADMILKGEYRYVSPVFGQDVLDEDTGQFEKCMLINIGLTNEPFLKNMMPLAASKFLTQEDPIMNTLLARMREVYQLAKDASEDVVLAKFNEMYTASTGAIAAKGKVIAVLGLKAEDTIETIEAKLTSAKSAFAFQNEIIAAAGLKADATLAEVKAFVIAAKGNETELTRVAARLTLLETNNADQEFERIVAKAFFEGRVHPTQPKDAEWTKSQKDLFKAKGSEAYVEYWGKQPVIAPVGKLPTDGVVAGKDGTLTEDEAKVANLVGVSADLVKKHNKTS